MNKAVLLTAAVTIIALGLIAALAYLVNIPFSNTLEFRLQDVNSKANVWDVTIKLNNRIIFSYFDVNYKFSNLQPGEYTLEISAPHYLSKNVPVKINSGTNIIENPIDLVGYEIPDLDGFLLTGKQGPAGFKLVFKPISIIKDSDEADDFNYERIVNHPCLDIKVGIRIFEQIKDGVYIKERTESGCERGEELFSGFLQWQWDSMPQSVFRYSVMVPEGEIKKTEAPFWVIDCLIVIPLSQNINTQELYAILDGVKDISEVEELDAYFKPYEDKVKHYYESYWNMDALKKQ